MSQQFSAIHTARRQGQKGKYHMQNPQIKFTYRDYLLLPEQDRRELIGGDFYFMPPSPNFSHQSISRNLGKLLWDFVMANNIGVVVSAPMDVVFSDFDVVQPDILFISNEKRSIITETNISGAPDLVVEILSPSTADRDRELKLSLYTRFGVNEYWIVDPENNTVQVLELGTDATRSYTSGEISSSVLPELRINIEDVFREY